MAIHKQLPHPIFFFPISHTEAIFTWLECSFEHISLSSKLPTLHTSHRIESNFLNRCSWIHHQPLTQLSGLSCSTIDRSSAGLLKLNYLWGSVCSLPCASVTLSFRLQWSHHRKAQYLQIPNLSSNLLSPLSHFKIHHSPPSPSWKKTLS